MGSYVSQPEPYDAWPNAQAVGGRGDDEAYVYEADPRFRQMREADRRQPEPHSTFHEQQSDYRQRMQHDALKQQEQLQQLQQQLQHQQLEEQQHHHRLMDQQQRVEQQQQQFEQQHQVTLFSAVSSLLRHGSELKQCVQTCFKHVAHTRQDGRMSLTINDLAHFRTLLSKTTGVPEAALGDIHDEFIRFDFDGDGSIEEHEAYKLVKYHLRDYLKQLQPEMFRIHMPWGSPEFWGFTIKKELGHGAFGTVRLAVDKHGKEYSIKYVEKKHMDSHHVEELKEEFEIMRELNDQRIARTFDLFQDDRHAHLVGEAYYGGSLSDLVSRAKQQGVDIMVEEWWWYIYKDCFRGLFHMHRRAMLHCDVKEPNIMLKTPDLQRPSIVIIDYGLAQTFASARAGICGTPGYIPPETWQCNKWYPKGDCFSMGVLMLQMLTDTVPDEKTGRLGIFTTGAKTTEDVRRITLTRNVPVDRLPGDYRDLKDLLHKLLEKDHGRRLNSEQVLDHPWLHGDFVRLPGNTPAPGAFLMHEVMRQSSPIQGSRVRQEKHSSQSPRPQSDRQNFSTPQRKRSGDDLRPLGPPAVPQAPPPQFFEHGGPSEPKLQPLKPRRHSEHAPSVPPVSPVSPESRVFINKPVDDLNVDHAFLAPHVLPGRRSGGGGGSISARPGASGGSGPTHVDVPAHVVTCPGPAYSRPLATQPAVAQRQQSPTRLLAPQPPATQPLPAQCLAAQPLATQPLVVQPQPTQQPPMQRLPTQPLATQPLPTQPLPMQLGAPTAASPETHTRPLDLHQFNQQLAHLAQPARPQIAQPARLQIGQPVKVQPQGPAQPPQAPMQPQPPQRSASPTPQGRTQPAYQFPARQGAAPNVQNMQRPVVNGWPTPVYTALNAPRI